MELIFTKGVMGKVVAGKIVLISIEREISTKYKYCAEDIKVLEDEYNIKLIGSRNEFIVTGNINEYDFEMVEGGVLVDITGMLYELDSKFASLYDVIDSVIFKDEENYERIMSMSPIFLSTEGIETDLFMSRKDFEKAILESELIKLLSQEQISKIIYMRDIGSLISSIQEFVLVAHKTLLEASIKINELLVNGFKNPRAGFVISEEDKENGYYEYKFSGAETRYVSSMYMSTIIQICSSLDLIAKLICEIDSFPSDFSKNVRFKSGGVYFNNIRRFIETFKRYDGFENSFINNKDFYNDLVLGRNMIVHNSFFSSHSWFYYGCNTHVVNNKPIEYMLAYIWDVDEDGNPERWLNRQRFYGQEREIGEYLANYLIKFYRNMDYTLNILIHHLKLKCI